MSANERPAARDSELVAVLRYGDHADPLICVCGAYWGLHGLIVAAESMPKPCDSFRYDFSNPRNAVKKLRYNYSVVAGNRIVMPYE